MAKYMLIESRDPFDSNDMAFSQDLLSSLRHAGHEVSLYLVQNGVLPARRDAKAPSLHALLADGVRVLADDFSLAERGLVAARLVPGVQPASLEVVLDHLAAGHKTLWH